jgi:hypothetical protein
MMMRITRGLKYRDIDGLVPLIINFTNSQDSYRLGTIIPMSCCIKFSLDSLASYFLSKLTKIEAVRENFQSPLIGVAILQLCYK